MAERSSEELFSIYEQTLYHPEVFYRTVIYSPVVPGLYESEERGCSTESAPPPTFHQTDHRMPDLQPFSMDVLCQLLLSSLPKLCELDPLLLPFLIKDYLDELLPFLLLLCNTALGDEAHPASQKRALVFPSLKRNGLDADDKKQLKLHLLHNSEH